LDELPGSMCPAFVELPQSEMENDVDHVLRR
jgi:hypothetical protein